MTNNTTHFRLWLRGFVIVFLTAANVVNISRGQWLAMFVTGFLISFVWWHNTQTAVQDKSLRGGVCYALGAGAGTVAGAGLALWLGG
jgi:hypothetical protein